MSIGVPPSVIRRRDDRVIEEFGNAREHGIAVEVTGLSPIELDLAPEDDEEEEEEDDELKYDVDDAEGDDEEAEKEDEDWEE